MGISQGLPLLRGFPHTRREKGDSSCLCCFPFSGISGVEGDKKTCIKKKVSLELDLQRKSQTFESPLAQTVMKERKEKEPFVFSSFFSFFFFLFPSKNQNQPTVMRIPTPGCSRAAGRWRWLHWEGSSRAGLRGISAIFQHRRGGWQSHTDGLPHGLPLPDTSSASVTHPGRCQWLSVRYGERQSIQALFSSLRPLQADDFPLCFPWPKQKKASHKSPDCSGGFFFPPFFSISTNSYLSFCLRQGLTGEEGAAAPWSSSVPWAPSRHKHGTMLSPEKPPRGPIARR